MRVRLADGAARVYAQGEHASHQVVYVKAGIRSDGRGDEGSAASAQCDLCKRSGDSRRGEVMMPWAGE